MHRPDPEMQRAAQQGDPNCKSSYSNSDNAIEPAKLQERPIASLYAVTYATAATIARAAFAVGAP